MGKEKTEIVVNLYEPSAPVKKENPVYVFENIHAGLIISTALGGMIAGIAIPFLTQFLIFLFPKAVFILLLGITLFGLTLSAVSTAFSAWIGYYLLGLQEEDKKCNYIPWK